MTTSCFFCVGLIYRRRDQVTQLFFFLISVFPHDCLGANNGRFIFSSQSEKQEKQKVSFIGSLRLTRDRALNKTTFTSKADLLPVDIVDFL